MMPANCSATASAVGGVSDFVVGSDCAGASSEAAGVCGASAFGSASGSDGVVAAGASSSEAAGALRFVSYSSRSSFRFLAGTASALMTLRRTCLGWEANHCILDEAGQRRCLTEVRFAVGVDELLHSWCYSTNKKHLGCFGVNVLAEPLCQWLVKASLADTSSVPFGVTTKLSVQLDEDCRAIEQLLLLFLGQSCRNTGLTSFTA